ncbi:MAG TPA: diadenylate cyclase, partial [Bacteroidales bacterium]|nr:diadenylate cyclase [Bacteroidales bacterium]
MILSFIHIRFLDIIDILLVAILLYQLYSLIKGTAAIKIFIGIALIYVVWLFVKAMRMELISSILGQVIGVGLIALIVVFQQEIRQFLLIIGNKYIKRSKLNILRDSRLQSGYSTSSIEYIAQAANEMSIAKTGALIVISREASLKSFIEQGEVLNADISVPLLKSIFFKDAPLHDGAVLIENNKIYAAKCILPVSANTEL